MRSSTFLHLFALIAALIASSCTPYKIISIETYEPKKVSIPPDKTALLIISNNIYLDSNKLFRYINGFNSNDTLTNPEVSTFETVIGLVSTLEQSDAFTLIQPAWQSSHVMQNRTINWVKLQEISTVNFCNIALVVDIQKTDLSIKPYYKNDYDYDVDIMNLETFYGIEAKYKIVFYLLNPFAKSIMDSISKFDFDFWETMSDSPLSGEEHLKDSLDIFSNFGYIYGVKYANRIIPSWIKDNRMLYHKGNDEMREAFEFVSKNNWQDAIAIWESLYHKSPDAKIAGNAAFNLAVANEVTGYLWKARLWAIRSFRKYESIETSQYANLLYERMQYYKQYEY